MLFALPNHLITDVVPTSSTSVDADYPLANLHDGLPTEVTRWETNAATRLVWDFTTPRTIEGLVIVMHSFLAAAGTLTLQANATDVWTSPSYSQALTVPAWPDTLPANIAIDTRTHTINTLGYRYMSLLIPAQTLEHGLGEILIVDAWTALERPPVWPVKRGDVRRISRNMTAYGVEHVVERGVRQRRLQLTLATATDTDRDALLTLARQAGGSEGFPIVYETAVATSEVHYVRFAPASIDEFTESLDFIDQSSLTLDLIEIQRGLAFV